MTAPRGSGDGLGGDGMSPAVIKGGILIVVALGLGMFLLWEGLDSDGVSEVAVGDDVPVVDETTTTTGGSSDTSVDETSTTTAGDARPNSEVVVIVANASGVPGEAGRITADLEAAGYTTAGPADAPLFVDTTVVYYVGDDEAEAIGVAVTLGIDLAANPDAVQPMPDPAPVGDLQGATILVMAGPDLAAG